MKAKALLVAFRSKLYRPCRKFLSISKMIRLKRPLLIRGLRPRPSHATAARKTASQRSYHRITALRSLFHSLRQPKDTDRVSELKSFSMSDAGLRYERVLFPSPVTPLAFGRMEAAGCKMGQEDAEDACRSFENYLVEMIAEEGRVRDLGDVEELLYCWKNLKCPVFIDLVCRFYAELCKDLFSADPEC